MITFNKPYATGKELQYIKQAIDNKWLAGNGAFTKGCQQFLEARYGIPKVLLTTSCTTALEMMALLLDIQPGDEVIMPSFTFVSSANAFVLRGARVIFVDSLPNHPNMDVDAVEELITPRTKAILAVHYAGMACDMEKLSGLCQKHNITLLEDAAQSIESTYKNQPLGTFGAMAAFSFHETKNIISGEGGALLINNTEWVRRAEIIWEKGTNRSAFFRGEVDKYNWVDVGSSYLPSEIQAAYLYAQLEAIGSIQEKRREIWMKYAEILKPLEERGVIALPELPRDAGQNYHLFYLLCKSEAERSELIRHLKNNGIHAVFHYQSLHRSPFYKRRHDGRPLPNCERYAATLLRLPFFNELSTNEVEQVGDAIWNFYKSRQ